MIKNKTAIHTPTQAGFTLVELAIVLMIIGLLIGGILRGQELMQNARINAIIQQVKAYQGAIHTFQDVYSSLPGDMGRATLRLTGCTVAASCVNGDGNRTIGNPVAPASSVGAVNNNIFAGLTAENTQFWKHLAMAKLISGINPSADTGQAEMGATHPEARVGGTFIIFNVVNSSGNTNDFGIGNNLRLQNEPDPRSSTSGNMAISPIHARQMDLKMDDGLPDRGFVTADFEGTQCDNGGQYQTNERKSCVLQFRID